MSLRARLKSETGVSLVELLVVMMIAAIVGAITTATIVNGLHQQRELSSRTYTLNDAKMTLERMTREIRAADPVLVAQPDQLRVEVRRNDATISYRYELESYTDNGAERYRIAVEQVTTDASGATTTSNTTLLGGLIDPDIFAYRDGQGNPATSAGDVRTVVVTLRAATGLRGGEVNLGDEITVRNAREHGG
jgi:type II secretory pathway pseudopilin PulG